MSSKLYLALLEKVAEALLQKPASDQAALIEKFPDCRIDGNRFELDGYTFYINFNGDDPEIAVTQGKVLPVELLLKINSALCGPDWFGDYVLEEYKATHEEAVAALEKVKGLQLDLIEFRREMGSKDSLGWVTSILREASIIGRIDKAIADIKTVGGLEAKPTEVSAND